MLTIEQKEDVIETMRVELEKMIFVMEEYIRREATPEHLEYFSKFGESWRSCLKRECNSFHWLRTGDPDLQDSAPARKDEWFGR